MFYFGDDPSLVVDFYVKKANKQGPRMPDIPWEEMDGKQIKDAYIKARIAYRLAERDHADKAVLDVLRDRIEKTFTIAVSRFEGLEKTPYHDAFLAVGLTIEEYKGIADNVRHPSSADAG